MAKTKGSLRKGTQLWKLNTTQNGGRSCEYTSDSDLWEACVEYFEWCVENPLPEEKLVTHRGKSMKKEINHPRPMTLEGLAVHLGISIETFRQYGKKQYPETVALVKNIMFDQKFAGASAGLMAPQLIARYLGLADKTESDNKHHVDFSGLSDAELKKIVSGGD